MSENYAASQLLLLFLPLKEEAEISLESKHSIIRKEKTYKLFKGKWDQNKQKSGV